MNKQNMAENSSEATSAKCFSGIFQRLLCGGSLPTHPSDQFKEPNTTTFDHSSCSNISSNKVAATNSPGIVARLMGLDSLPEEVAKTNFGSFSRSRSVNSLDYLMQFNLTDQQFHHRRVRTSVSFREIPYSDQEFKSEFLVFCFNNDKEEKQQYSSNNTIRKSNQEMKPKKVSFAKSSSNLSTTTAGQKKEVSGKQSRIANKVKKQVNSEDYPTKMSVESKKKKRKSKCVVSAKIQPLFNSADSSPIQLQQAATPAAVNEGKIQLNSRKSPASVTNPKHAIISKVEKQKEISTKDTDFYIKVLGETCRLTEEELNESHWIATRTGENFTFEDFEELCLQFGQEVLEMLVDQVVHELLIFVQ